MTPRQVREQIEEIDHDLKRLIRWEKALVAARRRLLLEDDSRARKTVEIIENGPSPAEGLPPNQELAPFSEGFQGLHDTRSEIAHLKEKRALLVRRRPSKAEKAAKKKEAEARAAEIRARAEALASRIGPLGAALAETARLALAVTEEAHRLWEENAALDRLTDENDEARPSTPRVEAPNMPLSVTLSALLARHFHGAQPYAVDPSVARLIRSMSPRRRTRTGGHTGADR